MIPFHFFLADENHPVIEDGAIWHEHVPLSPHYGYKKEKIRLSYGAYFSAVQRFLKQDDFRLVVSAISDRLQKQVTSGDINNIAVYLEKHGEFYHPSRLEIDTCGVNVQLVLNVAVSDAGKECLSNEYNVLRRLNAEFDCRFVPAVYGQGGIAIDAHRHICMFLGEWFKDYHEFHISETKEKKQKIIVWDPGEENCFLSNRQTEALYRKATLILASYYNPATFEQIYPWHNAAGDFVVKRSNDGTVDVKLITARQYRATIDSSDNSLQTTMEALLVFFLNLSIRMRTDRLNGVGDVVWADDVAVKGIVDGFFIALAAKPALAAMSLPLTDCFKYFVLNSDEKELYELLQDIVHAYHPDSPDRSVILQNLEEHVSLLYGAMEKTQI